MAGETGAGRPTGPNNTYITSAGTTSTRPQSEIDREAQAQAAQAKAAAEAEKTRLAVLAAQDRTRAAKEEAEFARVNTDISRNGAQENLYLSQQQAAKPAQAATTRVFSQAQEALSNPGSAEAYYQSLSANGGPQLPKADALAGALGGAQGAYQAAMAGGQQNALSGYEAARQSYARSQGKAAGAQAGLAGAQAGAGRSLGLAAEYKTPDTLGTSDADYGQYYDLASRKTAEKLNSQLAARGLFGGSVGADMASEAEVALRAEQANKEAEYNLKRAVAEGDYSVARSAEGRNWDTQSQNWDKQQLAWDEAQQGWEKTNQGWDEASRGWDTSRRDWASEDRAWNDLLTGRAGEADKNAQSLGALQLDRERILADAAKQADASEFDRMRTLQTGAATSDQLALAQQQEERSAAKAYDDARLARQQAIYNMLLGTTSGVSGVVGASYADAFNADAEAFNAPYQVGLAGATDAANSAANRSEKTDANADRLALYTKFAAGK